MKDIDIKELDARLAELAASGATELTEEDLQVFGGENVAEAHPPMQQLTCPRCGASCYYVFRFCVGTPQEFQRSICMNCSSLTVVDNDED